MSFSKYLKKLDFAIRKEKKLIIASTVPLKPFWLQRLANVLKVEMMMLQDILRLCTTTFHNEPTQIFTNYVRVLYFFNNHIKHSITHNSHLTK